MPVEIRNITAANLPDAARLCTAGQSLGDRPKAFTRDVEQESTRCKLSMLRARMAEGATALAAYREGLLVGYCEIHPVERSVVPVDGKGFHVIHCLRVPEEIERDEVETDLCNAAAARLPTSGGLAVIARAKKWSARGFAEIALDQSEVAGLERVLWFRKIAEGATPPTLVRVQRTFPRPPGKTRVDLFVNDHCPWDKYVFDMVRTVLGGPRSATGAARTDLVIFETDCTKRRNVLSYGVTAGIAVNGRYQPWLRPHRLPDEHMIRRAIEGAV